MKNTGLKQTKYIFQFTNSKTVKLIANFTRATVTELTGRRIQSEQILTRYEIPARMNNKLVNR